MKTNTKSPLASKHRHIAARFVEARLLAQPLDEYPGEPPLTLSDAYDIQDEAIRMWADAITGWKVGRIGGAAHEKYGCDRLAGPIFQSTRISDADVTYSMPVFEGGFGAVEAEIVILMSNDAPSGKMDWTTEEAATFVGSVHLGVEIASSPFPGINEMGPAVTISDFGNNAGLLVGPVLPDGQSFPLDQWTCETVIDGSVAGSATPATIPGGPLESLRFLLENTARRGLPLKRGMAVSTGAITGVHPVSPGQSVTITLNGVAPIDINLIPFPRQKSWG